MKPAPSITWTLLDPPAGSVARMRKRLAQAHPEQPFVWREAFLSFGVTFAVCWLLLTPMLARWQDTRAVEQAVSMVLSRPDRGPSIEAGAALAQSASVANTRFFLIAAAPGQPPAVTP